MIRPEAAAFFKRHSEIFAGLIIALIGLWLATRIGWFWTAIGVIIALMGLGLAFTAFRRLIFKTDQIGPGVVEVDERQISYFSAYEGGTVSIETLARITAITTDEGPWADDLHWVLEEDGGTTLTIPNSAAGAEQLFDAFAALDGVDYSMATKAMGTTSHDSFVIWSKPRAALH